MLKVESRFKLHRVYRGPYRVTEVTSTNVVIQPIHKPQTEPWNVSLQRVSKCSENLASSTPWLGYGWCTRKRRAIKKIVQSNRGEISASQGT